MKVSVVIPSYNHDKFIEEAIQSVLDQTFQDFEIIITDDGSSDKTVEKIQKFTDPRIKLFTFSENKGAYFAMESCLKHATGQYIAILSSDDIFLQDKLEKQVKFLDENDKYAAVFGFAQIIDEMGHNFTDKEHFYSTIFIQENRTRQEWLKRFFYEGNCLCHPSVLIRKEYYTIEQFDPRYRQLPDLDFWIKLCMKADIYILQENLIKFRILNNENNTSGDTISNRTRVTYEFSHVFNTYKNISVIDFIAVFGIKYGISSDIENKFIPFLLSLEALHTNLSIHKKFALDQLYEILGDKNLTLDIEKKYNFTFNNYFDEIIKSDLFNLESIQHRDHQIQEKDQQIQEKDHQIREKDHQIQEKDHQIQEKDHQIQEKDHQIQEKDHQIQEKDHQIQEKDHQLIKYDLLKCDYSKMYTSMSWQITRFLRKLKRLIK